MLLSPRLHRAALRRIARTRQLHVAAARPAAIALLRWRYESVAAAACAAAVAAPARAVAAPVAAPAPQIHVPEVGRWRVARTLAKWAALALPVAFWAPLAWLTPPLRERWWRHALWAVETCGPTATKLAQWSATRRDVFPAAWCDRAALLQTAATRTRRSHHEARWALRDAFGPDWARSAATLDDVPPLGAGCVAQVRRGRRGDRAVAVKLVHPRTRARVDADLRALAWLAGALTRAAPRTCRFLDPEGLVADFADAMRASVDMTAEAAALRRFRANFGRESGVVFPEPLAAKPGALVESYEAGVPLDDAIRSLEGRAEAKRNIARRGLRALLGMLFRDNFAHGDMHAGNLLIRARGPDFAAAVAADDFDLVVLDAGLVVELAPRDLRNFVDLFAAVVRRDGRGCGRLLVERARYHECHNVEAFADDVDALVRRATASTDVGAGATLEDLDVARLLVDVLAVCRRHRVRLESHFATTIVAITIVEGLGRQLDPRIDLLREAAPFVLRGAARSFLG